MKKKLKLGDLVYIKPTNGAFLIETPAELEFVTGHGHIYFGVLTKSRAKQCLIKLENEMKPELSLRKALRKKLLK